MQPSSAGLWRRSHPTACWMSREQLCSLDGQKGWEKVAFPSPEAEGSLLNVNDQLSSYLWDFKFMVACAFLFQT